MSRFFRAIRPFIRTIGNISAPLCVSFGVASTVPTSNDAPAYVQDVFKQFNHTYIQKTTDDKHLNDTIKVQCTEPDEKQQSESAPQPEPDAEPKELITPTAALEKTKPISASNSNQYLSRFIDHTVLKPKSTQQDIRKMCAEAIEYDFYSVCCNPCWVSLCKELLSDSNVKICCVVGFPLGSNTTQIKVLEAQNAVHDGADEIDMVMNIGNALSGNWDFVHDDIAMVVQSVPHNVAVKVILETCLLEDSDIIEACGCAVNAGAKFVKTSTGFGGGGATLNHVSLMRQCVDEEAVNLGLESGSVLVKASGGIRDSMTAKEMIKAGADRIGASSGIKIIGVIDAGIKKVSGAKKQEQY